MNEAKQRILSGVQPSGNLHLGNYIGAIRNWVNLQEEYDSFFFVADEHSITVRQNPADLRKSCLTLFAQFFAAGLDPEKSTLFIQSHVPQHAELAWILNCYTMFGELSRMTQFKDKSQKYAENINAGLFTYPALMAADILIYDAHCVPVGHDQKQHIEISRDIAERFNGIYGDVFQVPEPYIPPMGARIMSLTEPTKKMSKSDENQNGCIYVMDSPDEIMRKCKKAVTDSDAEVRKSEDKPGVSNLIDIYCVATGKSVAEVEREFDGLGYGAFKPAVGEAVIEMLRPFREKTLALLDDKAQLEAYYRQGAQQAQEAAYKMLRKVQKKLGFVAR
jgi:tryptophanyl-tRNA synthetase